jgi:prepilin-type N-terminal cleavage/methylation domain-containing protein
MSFNNKITIPFSQRGLSIIEVLAVVAIVSVLAAISFVTFFDTNRAQALEKDRDLVVATLERARSLTLASSGGRQYGVHIWSNGVVLFPGSSYVLNHPENQVEILNPLVTTANIVLTGGGVDVIFERLTGKTSQSGTFEVSLKSDPTKSYVITVQGTGIIDVN